MPPVGMFSSVELAIPVPYKSGLPQVSAEKPFNREGGLAEFGDGLRENRAGEGLFVCRDWKRVTAHNLRAYSLSAHPATHGYYPLELLAPYKNLCTV